MERRRLNIILVIATVALWGVIAYRLIDYLTPDEKPAAINFQKLKRPEATGAKEDTFRLLLNYRDPFQASGAPTPSRAASSTPVRVTPKTLPPPPLPLVWPEVQLLGIIKNREGKSTIALLRIDGQEMMLKEGEVAGELKLLQVKEKQVTIELKEERKTLGL